MKSIVSSGFVHWVLPQNKKECKGMYFNIFYVLLLVLVVVVVVVVISNTVLLGTY